MFVNKMRDFVKVKTPDDIDTLIKMMTATDLEKAEEKISLGGKLARLKNNQWLCCNPEPQFKTQPQLGGWVYTLSPALRFDC
ncbi:hypothetical protein LJU42_00880 [Citrobacter freundii]|uniref:hypothetical protein n=1 Tax=Citrobacter freundii TaxID=546 RepID=UPI001D11FECA|nr:hypothetical protein [Citrobacter freundii]UDV22680.1 hypothetical protein LJU42_00880 [Citrobacter freundii]